LGRRTLEAAPSFYVGAKHAHAHRASDDARVSALVLDAQLKRYRDLPRTVAELHTHLTEVDLGGWFRLRDGQLVLAMGKHAGCPLAEVARRHSDYLRWPLSLELLGDTRQIAESALGGQAGG
jgi:DNA polymerase-3 subunit epsilon